ncbi:MAG: serine protease [Verrucomicrobiales bacterium]|nr:serine protease [Verrucomicrobiales bacterium]
MKNRKLYIVKIISAYLVLFPELSISQQSNAANWASELSPEGLEIMEQNLLNSFQDSNPQEISDALSLLPFGRLNHKDIKLPDYGEKLTPGQDSFITIDMLSPQRGAAESKIGNANFLPAQFLVTGAEKQRSVARVTLKTFHQGLYPGAGWGTGFLVSETVFLTNHHVIPSRAFSKNVEIQFNFQRSLNGDPLDIDKYGFDPDSLFFTDKSLDITLIRVKPKATADGSTTPGSKWGHLKLQPSIDIIQDTRVNIVQHADGRHKEIVIHENQIASATDNIVCYQADTEIGSSGSPVFDNLWNVIAIHHQGVEENPLNECEKHNRGIRIDRVAETLMKNLSKTVLIELGLE